MPFGKLWSDFVHNLGLMFLAAAFGLPGLAFIVYVFSLLQGRVEFIIVSVVGLLYVHVSLQRLSLEDKVTASTALNLSSVGKLRVLLKGLTEERFLEIAKALARQRNDRRVVRRVDNTYLGIVEVFCLYQLLKHISEPFASFVAPLIPHALMPYL